MRFSTLFLILTWFTAGVLLITIYPVTAEHQGFDIARFSREISLNSASRFLGADLSLMGIVFIIWMWIEGRRLQIKRWWFPLVGIFLVGLAVIVPWFLYLREKQLENKHGPS